jgi:hypothetical protein
MARKVNYLNNKDILKEIHKSKNSYCAFRDREQDNAFDVIVHDFDMITDPTYILEARQARADRLAKLGYDAAKAAGEKVKQDQFTIPLEEIADTDVVFRFMTFDHIPLLEPKDPDDDEEEEEEEIELDEAKARKKLAAKHVKVNFPPFQHYRLDETGHPVCVGKSHWKGDVEEGAFNKEHGQMTNKLAHMFIKLCERYATRSNWRGYTYNDEMRSQALLQLAQIGLQFDESKSQNPFAYYTAAITNSFTRVLNIEKRNQNIRDDILEMHGLDPSWTRQFQNESGSTFE